MVRPIKFKLREELNHDKATCTSSKSSAGTSGTTASGVGPVGGGQNVAARGVNLVPHLNAPPAVAWLGKPSNPGIVLPPEKMMLKKEIVVLSGVHD